jgi:hypothetical protein
VLQARGMGAEPRRRRGYGHGRARPARSGLVTGRAGAGGVTAGGQNVRPWRALRRAAANGFRITVPTAVGELRWTLRLLAR